MIDAQHEYLRCLHPAYRFSVLRQMLIDIARRLYGDRTTATPLTPVSPGGPMSLPKTRHLIAASLLGLALVGTAYAAPAVNTLKRGLLSDSATGVAINGYDTVAYFTDGKPVKGSDAFVREWNGAKWKFASQQHLDLFKAAPEKYAPQYGGYCAYGVSQGYLVSIEPEQFTVLDGKLYLNYDSGVQKKWTKDIAGYNKIADGKFSDLLKK